VLADFFEVPPFGQSTDWFRNTAMDCRIAEQCADDQGPLVMNITLTKEASNLFIRMKGVNFLGGERGKPTDSARCFCWE